MNTQIVLGNETHSEFENLISKTKRHAYNLAYRLTGNRDDAEDLTQEVFVRIYRTLEQYDAKQGDLTNWLMRLARNLIIDDYRHRQRNPQNSFADDVDTAFGMLETGLTKFYLEPDKETPGISKTRV